ncbi:MAG: DUF1015 domain-containing protein [Phycisphaerae bacterium]
MAQIQPIPGVRYATQANNHDLSARLAPPYDVLDVAGKQALVARDPRNFVVVDLPHVPAKQAGPQAVYDQAGATLATWLSDGTMTRDATPAIYVYHQSYTYGGRSFVRKKFFARLRLEEFGKGSVFPHEQTFGGPKEDRFLLTKATRTNLSPIFGLYEDPANAVSTRLEAACGGAPIATGKLDGVDNKMWAVTDAALIADITRMMADKAVYIADGHHRYGTGLNYRKWVSEQGGISADHPANFVLCVFCAMEDAGLLILPTHRVLPGLNVPAAALKADQQLDVLALDVSNADDVPTALAKYGPQAVALFNAADGGYSVVRPKDAEILRDIAKDHSDAWRRLGLAFLHAYLLDRVVTPKIAGGTAPEIHYVKSASEAVAEAKQTGGSVFLLQSTTMQEMADVCKAGDLMPQKSTFFYPKLASGLVINPLE